MLSGSSSRPPWRAARSEASFVRKEDTFALFKDDNGKALASGWHLTGLGRQKT